MHLQETVFCVSAPPDSSHGPGAITLHDIQTCSSLASFKQTNAGVHCTTYCASRDSLGGFILSAQFDKSILNVFNFQKDQIALKIVLPEKLTCIAVDCRGDFCVGGTSHGRMYLWEIASGILYNSWDAHYRQVSVAQFTYDGAAILSGSEDSGVSVWSVSRLLDNDVQNELPLPEFTLADHTLPITDIVCGIGLFPRCRVLTSSLDHSVKLWDLSSQSLLTTFQFPQPISCLAWDITERVFFAASPDGSIHQTNLFRQREDKMGSLVTETAGGSGITNVVHVGEEVLGSKNRLISAGQSINCLSISLTGTLLLAGTSTGHIHLYDIASHQLLRSITVHNGLVITHLATMLKPLDLIGHVSLNLNPGSAADPRDIVPLKVVVPFQRMRDSKIREAHEVGMLLPVQNVNSRVAPFVTFDMDQLLLDQSYFTGSNSVAPSGGSVVLQSRVDELEEEVNLLREQLVKAKAVNDTMWETVVRKFLSRDQGEGWGPNGEENGEEVIGSTNPKRSRKRGRVD